VPSHLVARLTDASRDPTCHLVGEVALRGEIDAFTVDGVVGELCAAMVGSARALRADLRGVTFMDAAGVRGCLRAQQSARELGWNLLFVEPQGIVARLFELLELDETLLGEPVLA